MRILPSSEENPEKTGKLSVSVKDTKGKSVAGATVTLSKNDKEYTGTTGSAGGCTINNIPVGQYAVETEASGYTIDLDDVTITEGNNTLNTTLIKEVEDLDDDVDDDF